MLKEKENKYLEELNQLNEYHAKNLEAEVEKYCQLQVLLAQWKTKYTDLETNSNIEQLKLETEIKTHHEQINQLDRIVHDKETEYKII